MDKNGQKFNKIPNCQHNYIIELYRIIHIFHKINKNVCDTFQRIFTHVPYILTGISNKGPYFDISLDIGNYFKFDKASKILGSLKNVGG